MEGLKSPIFYCGHISQRPQSPLLCMNARCCTWTIFLAGRAYGLNRSDKGQYDPCPPGPRGFSDLTKVTQDTYSTAGTDVYPRPHLAVIRQQRLPVSGLLGCGPAPVQLALLRTARKRDQPGRRS